MHVPVPTTESFKLVLSFSKALLWIRRWSPASLYTYPAVFPKLGRVERQGSKMSEKSECEVHENNAKNVPFGNAGSAFMCSEYRSSTMETISHKKAIGMLASVSNYCYAAWALVRSEWGSLQFCVEKFFFLPSRFVHMLSHSSATARSHPDFCSYFEISLVTACHLLQERASCSPVRGRRQNVVLCSLTARGRSADTQTVR